MYQTVSPKEKVIILRRGILIYLSSIGGLPWSVMVGFFVVHAPNTTSVALLWGMKYAKTYIIAPKSSAIQNQSHLYLGKLLQALCLTIYFNSKPMSYEESSMVEDKRRIRDLFGFLAFTFTDTIKQTYLAIGITFIDYNGRFSDGFSAVRCRMRWFFTVENMAYEVTIVLVFESRLIQSIKLDSFFWRFLNSHMKESILLE